MSTTTVSRITQQDGRFTFTVIDRNYGDLHRYSTFGSGDGLAVYTGQDSDSAPGAGGAGWKQIVGTAQWPFAESNPAPATFRARAVRYFCNG